VEASRTFILNSNFLRQSTVAINCFRADFADKASKKRIRARNKLEFKNQSKPDHSGAPIGKNIGIFFYYDFIFACLKLASIVSPGRRSAYVCTMYMWGANSGIALSLSTHS